MQCHTRGCKGEVGEKSIVGLCKACYSYMYFWHKKKPAQLVKRATQLQIFEARIDILMPTNTIILGRKHTGKPLEIMPGEVKKAKRRRVKVA